MADTRPVSGLPHARAREGDACPRGGASHSCALTTGAAPRLRDFNQASISAIRSARSAKSASSHYRRTSHQYDHYSEARDPSRGDPDPNEHRHVLHSYCVDGNALFPWFRRGYRYRVTASVVIDPSPSTKLSDRRAYGGKSPRILHVGRT